MIITRGLHLVWRRKECIAFKLKDGHELFWYMLQCLWEDAVGIRKKALPTERRACTRKNETRTKVQGKLEPKEQGAQIEERGHP